MSVNETTGLEYEKTTHCTENCIWFKDTAVPSIHGQLLSQASTLASDSYTYDAATRLTQVQETPAGKGCTIRVYAYDEETNRKSLVSREPGAEGRCAIEGGTVERHTYDEANRLTDEGTAYDAFGDTTTLPASDAGGHELTSTYFVDGQLASQTQNAQTVSYKLDPAQRTREIVTGSTEVLEHYSSETDSPAWSKNLTTTTTTRYIQGIGGGLVAIQTNSEAPVLQLADLHGDIIATASLSETATKLLSTENSTEYGVPTTSTPARYSWLGAEQRPTELPSGTIAMGARSYVPQLGRFLQTDPQPGGSANAYAYTNGDPINSSDPSGEWTLNETSGGLSAVGSGPGENLTNGVGIAPGAIMPPPVNQQIEQAFIAHPPWDNTQEPIEEGGSGGLSNFLRIHGDPGLPPGARCEGNIDSKQYKKEHPKLCHENEKNPWEPADAFCVFVGWTNPITGYACGAYGATREATKKH
jgi:RHS repeat-associated protein